MTVKQQQQMKRRSIVDFEKWLDKEIATVETEVRGLNMQAEELARSRAVQDVRLETLRSVKVKLAPVAAEGFTTVPSPNGDDAEPSLFEQGEPALAEQTQ